MSISIKTMYTNDYDLSRYKYYKITIGGRVLQLKAMKIKPKGGNHIKNLSADEYMVLSTGEIKKRNRNSAVNSHYSWRKRAHNIMMIINANFSSQDNEVFITLTYAECMTDYDRCQKNFKSFIEKLKYYYPDIKYLAMPELQERGAWHIHVLVKSPLSKSLFIPKNNIDTWWRQGQTDIKRITTAENIGKYFISHDKIIMTTKALNSERVRLPWKSKNMIKSESNYTSLENTRQTIGDAKPNYSSQSIIIDDASGKVIQEILTQEYILDKSKPDWQKLLQEVIAKKATTAQENLGNTVQANPNKPCNK